MICAYGLPVRQHYFSKVVRKNCMQRIHDRLPFSDDLVDVVVEVENPVQRLLGRSDVITPRAEHDDWRFDVAQINALAPRRANLSARELVADEQVVPRSTASRPHSTGPGFPTKSRRRGTAPIRCRPSNRRCMAWSNRCWPG